MLPRIGHDLRTPLARLRSVVEAFPEERLSDPAVLDSYLAVLQSQTMRLSALVDEVDEVDEVTRITSGLVDPMFAPLALDDLVSNALADATAHARQRGVALTGAGEPGITVKDDLRLMRRVLDNLVDNAISDTPAGGRVHITASSRPEGVVLEIRDSCGGIPEKDLERLFDPGYRGDTSRRPDGRGFGLGLAIARGLAEANGAQMGAKNLDGGCRFSVLFAGNPPP